jgi:VWFA-related protein
MVIDAVASERDGTPVPGLTARDFLVTVNGKPATVVASRQIFRGPGSLVAAAQYGRRPGPAGTSSSAWAETSRAVVMAVDTTSLTRGAEKDALAVASRLLDRLGPEDRLGVVGLPVGSASLALTADHPAHREAIRKLAAAEWTPEVPDPKMTVAEALQIARGNRQVLRLVRERYAEADRPTDETLEAGARDVGRQCRERSADTMRQIGSIARGLAKIRGRKTLLFLTEGTLVDADLSEAQQAAMAAVEARTAVYVVRLPSQSELEVRSLEELARKTGGTLLSLQKNRDDALEQIARELSAIYELTVQTTSSGVQAHSTITITTSRRGLVVRSAGWGSPGGEENVGLTEGEPRIQAEAPAVQVDAAVGTTNERPVVSTDARDSLLAVLLGRAAEYVASYRRDFSSAIAEERYEQTMTSGTRSQRRTLHSDFLLLRNRSGWLPFRDVLEVDGKPVHDREERLRKLFLEHPATALNEAAAISDEGARYNIGPVVRNINVPTTPLGFLDPVYARRFSFSRHGQETVAGIQAWRVEFVEKGRPTIIQTPGPRGDDVPTDGAVWIDPLTGRVLRTQMTARAPGVILESTVTYRPNDVLGIWVPAEMTETYRLGTTTIVGRATYSNFRRFVVTTEEKVKEPE